MSEKQGPTHELPVSHVIGELGKVDLPTTYIGAQPKPGTDPKGGGFRVPPTRPGIGSGLTLNEGLRRETRDKIKVTENSVTNEHSARLQNLTGTTESDLSNLRVQHPVSAKSPAQAYQHELNIRNLFIQQKTAELHVQTAAGDSFYGHSPINKTIGDYLAKAQTLEKPVTPYGPVYARWVTSYKAAYSANFLAEHIKLLHTQHIHVQNLLAAAQAQEQRQLEAEREAHRVAAVLARANEEAADRAREQARLNAVENAWQLAVEQARIASEAAAQQVASDRALLEAQAEIKRQEEKAREAKEREEANTKKQAKQLARLNAMVAMFESREAAKASRPGCSVSGHDLDFNRHAERRVNQPPRQRTEHCRLRWHYLNGA